MLKLVDLPENVRPEPGMRGRLILVSDAARRIRSFLLPYSDDAWHDAWHSIRCAMAATVLYSRDVVLERQHPSGRWWVRVTRRRRGTAVNCAPRRERRRRACRRADQ
jgi:hypothetical protein